MLTLLEGRERVVSLNIRLSFVQADANRDEVFECLLELGIKLDSFLHGKVVELVGEYDCASGVKSAVSSGGDQVLVVGINLSRGSGRTSNLPVVTVILPQYATQTESIGDISDTIVDVTVRGTPTGGRDTNGELDHF